MRCICYANYSYLQTIQQGPIMPLTTQEASDIKSSVSTLERSVTALVTAQTKSTEAITELVIEMRERDVRDEFIKAEVLDLKVKREAIVKEYEPVLRRCKETQKKWDNFTSSMTTNWGRLLSIALLIAVLMLFGIDPSKIFKL